MSKTRFAATLLDYLRKAQESKIEKEKTVYRQAIVKRVSILDLKGNIVVIAEKPKAAKKIYEALSYLGYGKVYRYSNIPYWVIKKGVLTITITPAAGHLFGLDTDERGYPVFTYVWKPLYMIEKDASHTRKFIELLRKICSNGDYYINACDYDIEGSVIGFMVIKNFGDVNKCYRAKFSSLTKTELRQAFNNLTSLDWNMVEAGLCRHELDWIWGINVSRALMDSVYSVSGKRIVLSAGRVQTPTLRYVVENNIARNLFIPLPQYTISVSILVGDMKYQLEYKGPLIETRRQAEYIRDKLRESRVLVVEDYREDVRKLNPPPPFNLGDLQEEAAKIYKFSPYKTQSIAEKLYLSAYISYPRTNSQKLPPTLDYRGILDNLAKIYQYNALVKTLLQETRGVLKPVQGPKEDPAHPAIYPTGIIPQKLSSDEQKIYDLIVRRFLAVFAPPARIAHKTIVLKPLTINGNISFQLTGQKIVYLGWLRYYYFHKPSEQGAPTLEVGEKVRILSVSIRRVFTKPPEKLSRIKILRWMESNNIGTEATRARIIELLFKRKYLKSTGGATEATSLGQGVIEVLTEYFSELTSVELTRKFENYLEEIRIMKRRREEVINEAKKTLLELLRRFDEKKKEVGLKLAWRLGIMDPPEKCLLCNREVYRENLCIYHFKALEALKEMYSEWRRREGVNWEQYVRELAKLKSTGKWVREVIKEIIMRKI
ncbi:DNA topoisomerase I [Desulfurococcaceae archaeon MEX13E-LK6-19]|nr:DNA topoisomerase I [Desulfurococcaceae archaeon MEX13E-LK6-19]